MAWRRFFVDSITHGRALLQGDPAHHLVRVLRAEPGQRYEISDNRSLWLAEIAGVSRDKVEFRALEELTSAELPVRITLLAALFKFDRFEWMIEKATELGAAVIISVIAARSETGLEKAAEKRRARWRKIALESSQQSRRAGLPQIRPAMPFGAALGEKAAQSLFLDATPGAPPLLSAVPPEAGSAALLIGPEGGWTEAERARALENLWTAVSLGPHILRAETAALAGLALLSFRLPQKIE